MNKLYRIAESAEELNIEIDDPSEHYYKEYISIEGGDIKQDFGSKEEAVECLKKLNNPKLKVFECEISMVVKEVD